MVTKSFSLASLLFVALWFIHFTVKAFWALISEFSFFTAYFMLIDTNVSMLFEACIMYPC